MPTRGVTPAAIIPLATMRRLFYPGLVGGDEET